MTAPNACDVSDHPGVDQHNRENVAAVRQTGHVHFQVSAVSAPVVPDRPYDSIRVAAGHPEEGKDYGASFDFPVPSLR